MLAFIKDVFHQRLSSIKGCLPSKVIFHLRLSSIKSCLPSNVIFRQRSSSTKIHFPQRLSSIKGFLPLKVLLHQRLSSIKAQRVFQPWLEHTWNYSETICKDTYYCRKDKMLYFLFHYICFFSFSKAR